MGNVRTFPINMRLTSEDAKRATEIEAIAGCANKASAVSLALEIAETVIKAISSGGTVTIKIGDETRRLDLDGGTMPVDRS